MTLSRSLMAENSPCYEAGTKLTCKGDAKNLERMARAAIVRPNEAPRREDTGTKFPTEGQQNMAGREQVLMQVKHAFIAAGARFFEVPIRPMFAGPGRAFC